MALEMKSQDLFFRDNTRIGWFFACPRKTLLIFFISGASICLSVWLISSLSGKPLGSLPTPHDQCDGCNVGFFYRPNWAFMYLALLPTIFGLMSSILETSRHAVNVLSSPEIRVIEPALAPNNQSFEDSLYVLMRGWRLWIYWLAFGTALIVTGLTIYLLLSNPYATGDDWAAVMPRFAICIFLIQSVYIFLGVFWVLKFTSFIVSFIRLAVGRTTGFHLIPMIYDPERRMGLGIVGGLLNQFALATFLFEIYVAIYGIQAAADIHGVCLLKYVQDTFKPSALGHKFSLEAFGQPLHFSGAGVLALFTLSVLLWIVYIAIPIFHLRPRLDQMRKDAWLKHAREFESANRENNEARAKPLEREFEALRTSSFWPNGPTVGAGLMFVLLVIPLVASPFGPYLVTSGVLVAGYKALKSIA
jgi:hypothetical protein